MQVVAAIEENYLWVDSLYILQDDKEDKMKYLPLMDSIYSQLITTIIAAFGGDVYTGLQGITPGSRTRVQDPFNLKGVIVVQILDPCRSLNLGHYSVDNTGYLSHTEWNTRAWTLQEAILSPQWLVFTKEQVYWQCSQSSWCEDGFWENESPRSIYRHALGKTFHYESSSSPQMFESKYRYIVELYTYRKLTHGNDILAAFQGILGAWQQLFDVEFFWGLPTRHLGVVLTWPTDQFLPAKRRTAMCKIDNRLNCTTEVPFPSWSWVGWLGQVPMFKSFRKLTYMDAGIIFYKISSNGHPELIWQHVSLSIKRDSKIPPIRLKGSWRDESRNRITENDISNVVFTRKLWPIILACWSSTTVATFWHKNHDGTIRLFGRMAQGDLEIRLSWDHFLERPSDASVISEKVKLIIIGREESSNPGVPDTLVALVSNAETESGLTYRRGLANISESDWISLNRKWEKIFLA
jgi:hypothetical protein